MYVYAVHYSTESTQKEDMGIEFDGVGNQVIWHIQKETEGLMAYD